MKRVFLIIILFSITAFAQLQFNQYQETYAKEFFRSKYPQKMPVLFRAYPVYLGNDQYRVYLPVEMKHAFLQFLRSGDHYTTDVELETIIKDHETDDPIYRIWKDSARADNYESTLSKSQFHFAYDTLTLSSGLYDILFRYVDFNGEQKIAFQEKLALPKIEKFYAFPLLFVYPELPNNKDFPMVEGTPSPLVNYWDFNRDLGIFLQIWRDTPTEPIPLRIELYNESRSQKAFTLDSVLTKSENRQYVQVKIPKNVLYEGRYNLTVIYNVASFPERQVWNFRVVWFDKPLSLWDFDLSLDPLQYIMEEEDYKILRKGNNDDQIRKLNAYWEEKDPTGETPYNELKEEFYSRVDSTLFRFSEKRQLGWKTDLGRVYILNGSPDSINDHSLDPIPNPYMQWIYRRGGREIVYTFRAIDGRKEYKLAAVQENAL